MEQYNRKRRRHVQRLDAWPHRNRDEEIHMLAREIAHPIALAANDKSGRMCIVLLSIIMTAYYVQAIQPIPFFLEPLHCVNEVRDHGNR